jgi:hypothetical protein
MLLLSNGEIEFCKKLKADHKIFKAMVGMTQSNFYKLLQEVSGAYNQIISGNQRKQA